jgi:hypothetical protein
VKFKKSENAGGKNFLKLKAGDKVKGIFRGEPLDFRIHWITGRSSECPGLATCEHCKTGTKSAFRFRINFITKENDAYVAKILEQGWTTYELLESLHEPYNLEKTVVEITRRGEGLNTSYTVVPLPPPNGAVSPELEKKLAAIALHDLKNIEASENTGHALNYGDEVPF